MVIPYAQEVLGAAIVNDSRSPALIHCLDF